jgi:hypothetical protein
MKFFNTLFLLLISSLIHAQLSKKQVTTNINAWFDENPDSYIVEIKGGDAVAKITRYHPERPEDKDDIIKIGYKKMQIELKFKQPLAEITTHKDSLQKYFDYVSLNNIYNDISAKGWIIYPRTPLSALRGKGVTFLSGGESLSLKINWSIYAVFGYRDSKKCDNERSIADGSVSEPCYVSVRQRRELSVVVTNVKLGLE